MPVGTKLRRNRAWPVRSHPSLEAGGGGSTEYGQGPIKGVGANEVLLPTSNVYGPVTIEGTQSGVFHMAEAALGGHCIGGLVQGPVLAWHTKGGRLFPLKVGFDPGDPYKFVSLGEDALPQITMLETSEEGAP